MASRAEATARRRSLGRALAAVGVLAGLLTAVGAGPAWASVGVSLSADSNAVGDGQTVTFTATATNSGPGAVEVLMRMNMSGEMRGSEFLYVSSQSAGLASCWDTNPASTVVVCSGVISSGGTATLTVVGQAQEEGSGGPVTVTATVEGGAVPASAQTTVTVSGTNQAEEEEEQPGGSRRGPRQPTTGGQPTGGQPTGTACVIPKLAGKTLAAAKKALGKAHCKLGKVTKKKSKRKAGVVISQKPKAGTRLPAGGRVSLVLSRH